MICVTSHKVSLIIKRGILIIRKDLVNSLTHGLQLKERWIFKRKGRRAAMAQ